MITPGMCFLISFICNILSLNSVISKFISIIGNVIGGNTLAIFLADTIGPFVSAILGYSWDTQEHYVMSKICIIPLSFILHDPLPGRKKERRGRDPATEICQKNDYVGSE